MKRTSLTIRLEPPELSLGERLDWKYKNLAPLLHRLGLTVHSFAWSKIDMTSPKLPALVEALEGLRATGEAIIGAAYLEIECFDDEHTRHEWFKLYPARVSDDVEYENDTCKAYRMPSAGAVRRLYSTNVFVSDRFKSVVESNGLRGLDFLWLIDKGRYAPPQQWWVPIAREPIGRGLDDDWFDPGNEDDSDNAIPDDRSGISWFSTASFRQGVSLGEPLLDRLGRLLPLPSQDGKTMFTKPIRVLRDFLPDTDFAFGWTSSGQDSHPGTLFLSRKAKEVLERAGVVQNSECEAVLVLDVPPLGVAVLDRPGQTRAPRVTDLDLRYEQAKEAWTRYQQTELPPHHRTFNTVITELRAAKRAAPDKFARAATKTRMAALTRDFPLPIPAGWLTVLSICNGGRFGGDEAGSDSVAKEWTVSPSQSLLSDHQSELDIAKESEEAFRDHLLCIATNESGDTAWLDTSAVTPEGDCPVIKISHETLHPECEWASIAGFVDELLGRG